MGLETSFELGEFEKGWLTGLVDGEGCIFVSYSKMADSTHPCLRIYCTSKPIIERACRLLNANPFPRRDHGKVIGWNASVRGRKAVEIMRAIGPHLLDPSKKCRALTILKVFDGRVTIKGKHPSPKVFAHCPPPVRFREVGGIPSETDESQLRVEISREPFSLESSQAQQTAPEDPPAEEGDRGLGWLCGIVDGEGYIHVRYRSDRNTMYPRIRIFVKTKAIIDYVAKLMNVNPYVRRRRGECYGWYASVSHLKALRVLQLIAPHLSETSKKCRARKILEAFGEVGSVRSRLESDEFFGNCPPPSKPRKSRRVINDGELAFFSEVGKPGHPGGLIS
jgi:hypothetical protein